MPSKSSDIAGRVEARAELLEQRRKLDGRDLEHGGLIPADRERETAKRSMQGWNKPYSPDVTRAELHKLARGETIEDSRRIDSRRLYVDIKLGIRRYAPAFRHESAETLANDALYLLVSWPSMGGGLRDDGTRAPIVDLGGVGALRLAELRRNRAANRARGVIRWISDLETVAGGTLPMRRDWLERVENPEPRQARERLTSGAWRALHAAIKQAAESPLMRAELAQDESELATDPNDIAARVEELQRGEVSRLPDNAAPEVISESLGCTLNAARAIVARAYPLASTRDLAESWQLSPATLDKALSIGARQVREHWPRSADLIIDLKRAARDWRASSESSALLALVDYRDGYRSRADASRAVSDWRGASAGMPASERALLAASRRALQRAALDDLPAGAPASLKLIARSMYGSARAESIAAYAQNIIDAEECAELRRLNIGAIGTAPTRAPIGWHSSPLTPIGAVANVRPATPRKLTRSERAEDYARTARADYLARGCDHTRASGRLRFNAAHELVAELVCDNCGNPRKLPARFSNAARELDVSPVSTARR